MSSDWRSADKTQQVFWRNREVVSHCIWQNQVLFQRNLPLYLGSVLSKPLAFVMRSRTCVRVMWSLVPSIQSSIEDGFTFSSSGFGRPIFSERGASFVAYHASSDYLDNFHQNENIHTLHQILIFVYFGWAAFQLISKLIKLLLLKEAFSVVVPVLGLVIR